MLRLGMEALLTRSTTAGNTIFRRQVGAVGTPSGERGGSAQACGRSAEIAPEKAGMAAKERTVEQAQEASVQSLQRAYG
jgi:hypothetical protein